MTYGGQVRGVGRNTGLAVVDWGLVLRAWYLQVCVGKTDKFKFLD